MPTPNEKLNVFAQTIITIHYEDHELFSTFLHEWEFKIDTKNKIVEELYLFNNNQDKIITHKFDSEQQRKYYKYFKDIDII